MPVSQFLSTKQAHHIDFVCVWIKEVICSTFLSPPISESLPIVYYLKIIKKILCVCFNFFQLCYVGDPMLRHF